MANMLRWAPMAYGPAPSASSVLPESAIQSTWPPSRY